MGRLDGKVAVITGAASGIGRATAILFAKEGCSVVLADVRDDDGKKVVEDITKKGGKALYSHTDVSSENDVEKTIRMAIDKYGKLDIMFNNAGIEGPSKPMHEYPGDQFDRVLAINLKGVFNGIKYSVREMRKSGGGSIINTASVAGLVGFTDLAAYSASKGGVVELTRSAALEYARDGIRVNAIAPGVIATPMVERTAREDPKMMEAVVKAHPIGRMGEPGEIASTALFLATSDSSFVTGTVIVVDGGYVAQ